MKELVERQTSPGAWLLSTAAVLFSTASVFAFLVYFAVGTSIGDLDYLLDKPPKHDMEVRVATCCLIASLACLIGTIVTTTLALPRWGLSCSSRFIGRFVLAALLSTILTVLIGFVLFLIISAFSPAQSSDLSGHNWRNIAITPTTHSNRPAGIVVGANA